MKLSVIMPVYNEATTIGEVVRRVGQRFGGVYFIVSGRINSYAVDAAGVHPLLLALGSERYVPYEPRRPRELLTQANAILGQGQLSLAKYLWIAAAEDESAFLTALAARIGGGAHRGHHHTGDVGMSRAGPGDRIEHTERAVRLVGARHDEHGAAPTLRVEQ